MLKIQQYGRIQQNPSKNTELYIYAYQIFNENLSEIKFVIIVQDRKNIIYDVWEKDFLFNEIEKSDLGIKEFLEILKGMQSFYNIKETHTFLEENEIDIDTEFCEECKEPHLLIRSLNIKEMEYEGILINKKAQNSNLVIFSNIKQPKVTRLIFPDENKISYNIGYGTEKEGLDNFYQIFITKHNCGDYKCNINGKIICIVSFYENGEEIILEEFEVLRKDKESFIKNKIFEVVNKVSENYVTVYSLGDGGENNKIINRFYFPKNLWE